MILALSETRLTVEIEDSEVNVPGYSIVRCDAENRNTGGVLLYVRDDIKFRIVDKKKIVSNCWCVVIEMRENLYKGMIAVVYHSPSASNGDFVRFLEDTVEDLIIKYDCIVIGDFNIDIMVDSFYTKKLLTVMQNLGMRQYVECPTRVTKDSRTMIDLIFSNKEVKVQVNEKPKITDHAWLKVEFNMNKKSNKYKEFRGRDYSKFNVDDFLRILEERSEQGQGLDISIRAERFVNSIVSVLDTVAPKKMFKIPRVWEGKKWYSDEIRMAAVRRDEAHSRAISSGKDQDWEFFKNERNAVVKLIRAKKKEYYENMIDNNRSDPTKMWKTLKELIKGEQRGSENIDNVDFEVLEDIEECNIADKFNIYYVKSISNIVQSISNKGIEGTGRRPIYVIETKGIMENFEPISASDLEQIVRELPRKNGTEEGINSDILKMVLPVIKDEFVGVINDSLRTGKFPEGWKTSTIIPIPKVNKPKKASEYRPINMLPIYEKVLELVVKKQLEKFLEDNEIITEYQSGFRRQQSCETAIQSFIEEWKLIIEEKKMVGVLFLDLRRAFETIDRVRLVEKLYQYGIRGVVLEWIISYLSNRKQQVRFNDICSKIIETVYGVPQGSVLGPLLFILYINDIVKVCPEGSIFRLFADDTTASVTGESCEELEIKLNMVLGILEEWMNVNMLKMNADKTKYMIVRSIRKEIKTDIIVKSLDGTIIERVEITKHLGVMIDSKLRWDNHCDYMLKKIGKKISFLNRIGNDISVYTRCTVYKSIIAPHFEYCATILVGMGETQLNRLQVAQNRAMRVILQCSRYTKVELMLQTLKFMNVRQRLMYNVCIFIFKIVRGIMPKHLRNRIEIVGDVSGRQTRQAENIRIQYHRTRSAQKSLFYEGLNMYNALPIEIKQCERIVPFKRRLREYIVPHVEELI